MIYFLILLNIILIIYAIGSAIVITKLFKQQDLYETTITEFYSSVSIVLHTMRTLDNKKMFETDDEVGYVFSQLVEVLSMLRPILYGPEPDEEEKN